MSAKTMPGVPDALRGVGRALLRHYPTGTEIHLAHQVLPAYFGPVVGRTVFGTGTQLSSAWGGNTGWLSPHEGGYGVAAELAGVNVWYWAKDRELVLRAFHRACRRTFMRRLLPWLAPPPVVLAPTLTRTVDAMSTPSQRTNSVIDTKRFLERLLNRRLEPDVPDAVRKYALALLRHYPFEMEIEMAHHALPALFGPVLKEDDRHDKG